MKELNFMWFERQKKHLASSESFECKARPKHVKLTKNAFQAGQDSIQISFEPSLNPELSQTEFFQIFKEVYEQMAIKKAFFHFCDVKA